MKGPADGSGGVLSFNADSCYKNPSAVSFNALARRASASMSIRRAPLGREWTIIVRGAAADFRVCVYNLRGQRVKDLSPNRESEGEFTYFWDGTGGQGQKLTKGVYLIKGTSGEGRTIVSVF
jgi:FlgD Ig-like domain